MQLSTAENLRYSRVLLFVFINVAQVGEQAGDTHHGLPQTMSVLGVDGNVHQKSLQQAIDEVQNVLVFKINSICSNSFWW